ncbi:MAG: FCD domain-containing protein [Hyphomicrobiales bacterium]
MYYEKELASLVGFGRTPVRQALQRLEIEGLVLIKQRKGIQITEVDLDVQLRLLKVRRPLQNFIAEYAAERANEEDRRTMFKFGKKLGNASQDLPGTRSDALIAVRQAHDLVVEACHNEFAKKTMRIVFGVSRRFWISHMQREDFNIAAELHSRLLINVAEGKTKDAVTASNALLDYLEDFALKQKNGSNKKTILIVLSHSEYVFIIIKTVKNYLGEKSVLL